MSEVVEKTEDGGEQTQVTVDDLQRMLDDMRKKNEDVTSRYESERTTRFQTQQELESERAARIVTEHERDGAAARVVNEAEQRYIAQRDAFKHGIEAQRERVATAEEALARYSETGEWKLAAAAQRQMAEAAAKLTNLEAQHEYLEANKEKFVPPPPQRQEVRQPPRQPVPTDRISQIVGGDLVGGERSWLEKRPKFLDDPSYQKQVFGASGLATGRGYTRGSEPYFREMERILGEGTPDETPRHDNSPRQERTPSADIAPQRRASPGQVPQGSREIRLTADQAEVADGLYGNPNSEDFIPDQAKRYQKYYENLERRRASGRM